LNPGAPLTLAADKSLTVQTKTGDITIGSPITTSGTGGIVMQAGTIAGSGGRLVINADLIAGAANGTIALQADGGIRLGDGRVSADLVDLSTVSTGGVTQSATGALNTPTLRSPHQVNGDVSLAGTANAVGSIGDFAVNGGGFALANTTPLTVKGTIASNGDIYLQTNDPAGIAIASTGKVAAGAASDVSFQAASLAVAAGGTVTGGTFEFAPNSGALALGTGGALASLVGVSTANAEIGGVTVPNQGFGITASSIATVGNFDANNLPLTLRTTGTIGEPTLAPIVNVATLSGGAASVRLDAANAIANVGSFTASSGDFLLNDSALPLRVFGPVTASGDVTLHASALAVTGDIGASGTVALNADVGGVALNSGAVVTGAMINLKAADGIRLRGDALVGKPGAVVDLSTTDDGVRETATATIIAGTLQSSGGIAKSATLSGSANAIAAMGSLAVDGPFSLTNTGNLSVGGKLNATAITISDNAALTIPGIASATGAMSLAANSIAETGVLSAGALTGSAVGAVSLTGNNAIGALSDFSAAGFKLNNGTNLAVLGTVSGGSNVTIVNKGALTIGGTAMATTINLAADSITETGMLKADTLTGSAVNTASLTGTSFSNRIGTLNGFSAAGFTLDDGIALTVLGALVGGPRVEIASKGALAINGAVGATTVSLNADSITEPGAIAAVTLTGSTAGSASLTGTAFSNSIGTLNGFTAAGFTLDDNVPLTVAGTVLGGPAVTILGKGTLAIDGTVIADTVSLTAGSITIPGNVTGASVGLLGTIGAISETGAINAGVLTGSAATTANLTGTSFSNQIASVSRFTASGFNLVDGADLTITGNLNGGPSVTLLDSRTITVGGAGVVTGNRISATAFGDVSIPGAMEAAGTLELVSGGNIIESGTLVALSLTGTVVGDAKLTGTGSSNRIYQLGSFTSGGTFTLGNSVNLPIDGPLTAPTIVIDNGVGVITLADQAVITTGGTRRPAGVLSSLPGDTPATTSNGAFLTTSGGFVQQGTSAILGISDGPSVLRINAKGGANITFDATAGLQGRNTWLILDIGSGLAQGRIDVHEIDVIQNGQGEASLTGMVTGLSGPAAAGVSDIQPLPNPQFRINSCPIHSVSCVLLPAESVPVGNPLNEIYFGSTFNPNEDQDLLLPIVSDRDY
jgi:hypothetical protein